MSNKLKKSLLICGIVMLIFGFGEVISRIHFDRSNQNFFFYVGCVVCGIGIFLLLNLLYNSFCELRDYRKVAEEYYIFKIKKENETIHRRIVTGEEITAFMDKHNMDWYYFHDFVFQNALSDYMDDYNNTLEILVAEKEIREYEADKFYCFHESMALKNGYVFAESSSGNTVLVKESKLCEWKKAISRIDTIKRNMEYPFERIKRREHRNEL